jgi:hypothetical protein
MEIRSEQLQFLTNYRNSQLVFPISILTLVKLWDLRKNEERSSRIYVSFVVKRQQHVWHSSQNNPNYGLANKPYEFWKLKNKWTPGMIGSKQVRTSYNRYITVQVNYFICIKGKQNLEVCFPLSSFKTEKHIKPKT